jgi:hypothetical protein
VARSGDAGLLGVREGPGPAPDLADVLGERHRIIANDWQAAALSSFVSRLVVRALELVAAVDLTPGALRADLAGPRLAPSYLHSATELLDRAADLVAESAALVHDNERRWRAVRGRIAEIMEREARQEE